MCVVYYQKYLLRTLKFNPKMVDLISMGNVTHTLYIYCVFILYFEIMHNTVEKNTELFEHLFDHLMKSDNTK